MVVMRILMMIWMKMTRTKMTYMICSTYQWNEKLLEDVPILLPWQRNILKYMVSVLVLFLYVQIQQGRAFMEE